MSTNYNTYRVHRKWNKMTTVIDVPVVIMEWDSFIDNNRDWIKQPYTWDYEEIHSMSDIMVSLYRYCVIEEEVELDYYDFIGYLEHYRYINDLMPLSLYDVDFMSKGAIKLWLKLHCSHRTYKDNNYLGWRYAK